MNYIILFSTLIVVILFIVLCVKLYGYNKEEWYPTNTYVNTPTTFGIYPNNVRNSPYYNSYVWPQPVAIRDKVYTWAGRPASQVGYPLIDTGYIRPLADVPESNAPIPYGNPIPSNTIRMFGPMLTSIKSTKDYAIGQWVYAGTAYTDNPNDDTFGTVYQLNLDPGREFFRYSINIPRIGEIPINLPPNQNRLQDGDRFKVQGLEGKGDFVFAEADKYRYVYV